MVVQGYGEAYLKIPTLGDERANRRVTVRNISPILQSEAN
jgi:outer membrane protein OmpA-like peptidoglycan-associated protein